MDTDPPGQPVGNVDQGVGRYESIVETIRDGIFVIDPDGTITYVNDALCTFTGRERRELIDATFETLVESNLFRQVEHERFNEAVTQLFESDERERSLTVATGHEDARVLEIRLSSRQLTDGTEDIVGVARDITERKRALEAAERKREALRQLYEISADAGLTFEEKAEQILAIGCEYLDLPYGFLTRIDEGTQRMVHTVGDHELLQSGESAPLEQSYCRKTIQSDDLVGMRDARTELGEDDPAYEVFELGCYVGTKIVVGTDLYGTFCFAASATRDREFVPEEREVVKLLGQWAGHELERQRFEDRLQGLHRIAQQLLLAETAEEVAEITLETGKKLFDLPVMACWEYDVADDVMRPVAETEEAVQIVGEAPTFERGDGLIWDSFDSGEIRSYEDVTEQSGAYNPETALRSEIHVPCGNHGIFTCSATEPRAFDEIDTESLRLLGALVTAAMTAVKREEKLVERGEALQRQNERLDEFGNLVAHDLRNPLAGAVGALEIARETNEPRFFERTEQSLQRIDDLIGELLDIARGDRESVEAQTLPLESVVTEAWSYLDTSDASLSVNDDLGWIRADETRLLQLFGNLFRNSLEHVGHDVTVEVGLLDDANGFYVADDGPGLPEDFRKAFREFGQTSSASEIGIGLASVTDIVEAHNWNLSVPQTGEGARFEIRTDSEP